MISDLLFNQTGKRVSEEAALATYQLLANRSGKCIAEALPVETNGVASMGLMGNLQNNSQEQWLYRIICVPKNWNADRTFYNQRVINDEDTLAQHSTGEPVYSEFAGRNIAVLHRIDTKVLEHEGNTYSEIVPFCIPDVEIPFGVGDIIVVPPQQAKEKEGEILWGKITKINTAVAIEFTDILGYMKDKDFEPFLHLVVHKVVNDTGAALAQDHQSYKGYLRYERGATFLPIKANALLVTDRSMEYGQPNVPFKCEFIYKGKRHEYRLVSENKRILAYKNGKEEWTPTPTCEMAVKVRDADVMEYLEGERPAVESIQYSKKYYKSPSKEGYIVAAHVHEAKLPSGDVVFIQKEKKIGHLLKLAVGYGIDIEPHIVAFNVDLENHYRISGENLAIPNEVRTAYANGKNILEIRNVIEIETGLRHIMADEAFGFATIGFLTEKSKPIQFFYKLRSRIRFTMDNNNKPIAGAGRLLVKRLPQKPQGYEPISTQLQNKIEYVEILSVGRGTLTVPMDYFKEGQIIGINPARLIEGGDLKVNGEHFYVVKYEDVDVEA